jgi:hypothetical protein
MANNKDFKVKNGIQPTVYHEGLGTVVSGSVGYSLSAASYDSVSFSVTSQETSPTGLFFKSDGLKVYIVGLDFATVFQYSLSTAWDTSTASYDSVSFSVSSQDTIPTGLSFKSDGTKMYVVGNLGVDINEYNLSTAWDISTASYSQNFSVSSQETAPYDVTFKTDGTKMYICGLAGDEINEYNLSTAWDISTASASQVFSVSAQEGNPRSLFFKSDGTKLFLSGTDNDSVYLYNLSTAWDISTASYDTSFSVTSQDTLPTGIYIKPDGTKMYVTGYASDAIYQYSTVLNTASLNLSTGSVFDLTPTSDVQVTLSNPADSGTVSQATLLLTGGAVNTYDVAGATYDSKSFDFSDYEPTLLYGGFFKPDGTKFFIIGTGTDKVQAFNLSTAWDISTVSAASEEFSPTQAGTEPISLSFKSDGTKMYVSSYGGLTVYQYSLSTAWDVSTATYDSKSFSYSSQTNAAYHFELSLDGTKLYVNTFGSSSPGPGFIFQYTLSTAWDISTASYGSVSLDLDASPAPALAAQCFSFTFSDDGTKLFNMAESSGDAKVFQYDLTSAWDISTATYAGDAYSYDITDGDQNDPTVFRLGDSGEKMYYGGTSDQTIYQFTIASAGTITYDSTLEWPSGTAPTSPAYGETDVLTFTTSDGGTTYQAVQAIDGAS